MSKLVGYLVREGKEKYKGRYLGFAGFQKTYSRTECLYDPNCLHYALDAVRIFNARLIKVVRKNKTVRKLRFKNRVLRKVIDGYRKIVEGYKEELHKVKGKLNEVASVVDKETKKPPHQCTGSGGCKSSECDK